MPARPGACLVLIQPHVALLRLELGLDAPPGGSHVCQGLQRGILRSVGQIVARFAAVRVPAVDGPVDLAGLPPAGRTHPLSAEQVAAGTLASLGHRNSRQASSGNSSLRSSIVRRCPPTSLGLRGAPRPWYAGLVRSGSDGHTVKPAGTSWTYRIPKAASPSRNDGDIPKASSPATQPAFRWPTPRPSPASPGPIRSSTGNPASPPEPLPPHTGLCPRSSSPADTAVCPPRPVPTG